MSRTTVVRIWPGRKTELGEELKNSWGTAALVWDFMSQEYLNGRNWLIQNDNQVLWNLYLHQGIPFHQRAVFVMTFDNVWVVRKNYARMAADIHKFLEEFSRKDCVNHWPRIAEILLEEKKSKAIGLWITSVTDNPFGRRWNGCKNAYDRMEWKKFSDVYELLDGHTNSPEK